MSGDLPFDISELEAAYAGPYIPRNKVEEVTFGLLKAKTLANFDSIGSGPPGAFRIGGKVVYPSRDFFKWLASRIRPIERKSRPTPDDLVA